MSELSIKDEKHKVWIVDDERDLADIYSQYLSPQYQTRLFHSAKEAIIALNNENMHPDLILADIRMPEMDGLSFIETIRNQGIKIPAVLISGQLEKNHLLRSLDLKVNAFLEKPCSPDELEEQVKKTIFENEFRTAESTLLQLSYELIENQDRLITLYLNRYAPAENELLKNSIRYPAPKDALNFLREQKQENDLNRIAESILRQIKAISRKFSN